MKIIKSTLFMLAIAFSAMAQFGEIRGIVTDKKTGQILPGATVSYYITGNLKGTTTDEKGEYKIKPLVPGSYDLEFSYVMYKKQKLGSIVVSANKTTYINITLEGDNDLPEIVIKWQAPLIDPGTTPSMVVLDAEEINNAVSRDISDMVANTVGVFQKEEGGSLNVRGARENSTIYVVDGIRMHTGFSLPKSAIAEVTVLTGGIPAQYGDATGGIVLITTKSYRR
jgi:hypothetical protein